MRFRIAFSFHHHLDITKCMITLWPLQATIKKFLSHQLELLSREHHICRYRNIQTNALHSKNMTCLTHAFSNTMGNMVDIFQIEEILFHVDSLVKTFPHLPVRHDTDPSILETAHK